MLLDCLVVSVCVDLSLICSLFFFVFVVCCVDVPLMFFSRFVVGLSWIVPLSCFDVCVEVFVYLFCDLFVDCSLVCSVVVFFCCFVFVDF